MRRSATVLVLALTLASCERPFVDVRPPDIEILQPDPTAIVPVAETLLRIRATSFRGVGRVTINGKDADRESEEIFSRTIKLVRGMNEVVVEAFDPEEVPSVDTLHLLRLSVVRQNGPVWSHAVGGHTATLLQDGRLLLAGGAAAPGALATDRTMIVDVHTFGIVPGPSLLHARTGHTATRLPDGRIVVFGGSTSDDPDTVAEFVEEVEILDANAEMFTDLVFSGDPVRRSFHSAELRSTPDGPIVALLGGMGDTRYGSDPRVGVRDDLRSFRIVGDSVVAVDPWFGLYVEAVARHTLTALHSMPPGDPNEYLLTGALFSQSGEFTVNYVMDTRSLPVIYLEPVPEPVPPRTHHAAVRIDDGRVLLIGGTTREQDATATGAVFDQLLDRFLAVPEQDLGTPHARFAHTATLLPDGRILTMGGFDAGGAAESQSDLFLY